jgi:hypothetical protein
MNFTLVRLFAFAVIFGMITFAVPSSAQHDPHLGEAPPLDHAAIFNSHVHHAKAQIATGKLPDEKAITATPANPATFSGTTYIVGPTVTPTTTVPEAEEHIAVDPNNSNNLVAAISDFALRGGFNTTKYAFSFSNGAAGTWSERYVPLDANGFPATGDGRSWEANSDPVVAIDKLGNVFLADLYFNSSNNANGLYVSVATLASGVAFTAASTYAVATNPSPTASISEDKEWIAVDNSSSPYSGNVYVSWTRFTGCTSGGCSSDAIVFSRSTDHGKTWSAPIQISPSSQNGAVQGSQVAVGPNGEVYVAYEVFFVGGKRQHFLAKSTNGGISFTTPVAATPFFNELSFKSTYRKNSFASLAISPTNGNVYLVYSDQPSKTLGAEVEFVKSASGGASFTAPVVINDASAGQQFMPAVTVDSSGVIHASWFDTRNSGGTSSLYDIYATRSFDGGNTFNPNARVTASLVNAGNASFIGDYAGIAAGGGFAHPVWTSGGFNNGRLQTATLQ